MENPASGAGDVAINGLLQTERPGSSHPNLEVIDKLTTDQLQLLLCQKNPPPRMNIAR